MLIEGVFAAVPTPFYPDERVYLRKMEANIARYSRSLLAGMLVLGSTGEAPLVSDAESREVLRAAAAAAAPEKLLIAGVGRESVRSTVELAEAAAEYGYDAVLVRVPTYYSRLLTPEFALHYFRCVADSSPLPVILYNIPFCAPWNIPVEVVAELALHPNIIGIKDSSGDVERIAALVAATKDAPKRTATVTPIFEAVTGRMLAANQKVAESVVAVGDLATGTAVSTAAPAPALKTRTREVGFQVLCGNEATLLPALEAGASGGILAFASFAPQAAQEIFSSWKEHNQQLAQEKQQLIAPAGQRVVGQLGIAGIKYACDFNGFYGGYPRRPILPLTAETRTEIEELLAPIRL
jgi:dihydrodipicolinate synthase/N-acetylneuraminate lyase